VTRALLLGTRGSALALAQTRIVTDALGASVETRIIRTAGDASSRPLQELGDGVFVTAIEDALRSGEIDAAVHSLKDLPTGDRPELVIAAVLPREDPRDVLVTSARGGLATLPRGRPGRHVQPAARCRAAAAASGHHDGADPRERRDAPGEGRAR